METVGGQIQGDRWTVFAGLWQYTALKLTDCRQSEWGKFSSQLLNYCQNKYLCQFRCLHVGVPVSRCIIKENTPVLASMEIMSRLQEQQLGSYDFHSRSLILTGSLKCIYKKHIFWFFTFSLTFEVSSHTEFQFKVTRFWYLFLKLLPPDQHIRGQFNCVPQISLSSLLSVIRSLNDPKHK